MVISSSPPRVVGLVPARLASVRLPDKPLIDLHGKTMIHHVWERVTAASLITEAAIATPDSEIEKEVIRFGGRAVLTLPTHRSGTDRLAEAADLLGLDDNDIVVNIQGDEPLLDPTGIDAVVSLLQADDSLVMSSLRCVCPVEDRDNPNCVKVVCAANGDALYFSRANLPYPRHPDDALVFQHVGLYAYRRHFLRTFASLPASPLERAESLEQLRVLENGYRIRMAQIESAPIGIDTPEDLARALQLIGQQANREGI